MVLMVGRGSPSTNLITQNKKVIFFSRILLFLVPMVGLEPTWFPAGFWIQCVYQFRHIGIYKKYVLLYLSTYFSYCLYFSSKFYYRSISFLNCFNFDILSYKILRYSVLFRLTFTLSISDSNLSHCEIAIPCILLFWDCMRT